VIIYRPGSLTGTGGSSGARAPGTGRMAPPAESGPWRRERERAGTVTSGAEQGVGGKQTACMHWGLTDSTWQQSKSERQQVDVRVIVNGVDVLAVLFKAWSEKFDACSAQSSPQEVLLANQSWYSLP
jgi:hypothetical protein